MKAYFQNLQKVVVFACGQYLSKLTNLTDDVPRLLATDSLTKPKSGEQMCAEFDGLCGVDTACTSMNISQTFDEQCILISQ